ncbi:MAG: trypsin-like peptidase domain-containing protein [Planctomycetes bacterium]|nr:trypsin-like peptidase domain-containing protein [Planctomycetota bacterium]
MWAKLATAFAVAAFALLVAWVARPSPAVADAKAVPPPEAILEKIEALDRKIESDRRMDRILAECRAADESLRRLHEAFADFRRDRHRDAALLDRAILQPSVQVSIQGSVGGGTIIHSHPEKSGAYGTYVITAFHVVQKALDPDGAGEEMPHPVLVRVYGAEDSPDETVDSDLLLYDERKDLALLKLRSRKPYPLSARLASRDHIRAARVFTPIYTVGCPLGHDPLPSFGEITTHHKEVNGERFWMMSAPTIFGNSGGGVFHRETLEMIGVSAMICTFENPITVPVPHLGILVPLDIVYDWLAAHHYQFLFDEGSTPEPAAAGARR